MKKSKGESKPSGKYPALYYQDATGTFVGDRIRIIYPSGKAEWRSAFARQILDFDEVPCWLPEHRSVGFQEAIELMHQYDYTVGLAPAIYLGELK